MQAHNQPTYTNSNAPCTLDAIYLRPAQNMQGGHELMDLTSGLVITCANVTEIPVTDLVIKAVEKMGYGQGFPATGMKFTCRQGQIYLDNDWIAGVDYGEYEDEENLEDPDPEDEENREDENDHNNEETDYEEQRQELAEILHEPPEDNPTIDIEEEASEQQEDNEEQQESEDNEQQEVDNEEQHESEHEEDGPETETELRRSTRKEVDQLNLIIHGILKTKKKVTFMNQDVESKHDLYTQSSPNPHADVEYARDHALLIAKAMVDLYHKDTTNTWSFGQQHILQKGLKMLKKRVMPLQ